MSEDHWQLSPHFSDSLSFLVGLDRNDQVACYDSDFKL